MMVTTLFLATFVVASLALGSALFVVVGILPTILPPALAAARRRWDEALEKAAPGAEFVEEVERVQRTINEVSLAVSDVKDILRYGFASATSFIAAALLGLWYLAFNPAEISGIEYASMGGADDLYLIVLFGAG